MKAPTSNERIPCRNPNCRNTILPATAAVNGGLCAPCVGKIRKAERGEFIRLNRRTVNLYEGVTDSVEIICIMLTRRKHDPLIEYAPAPKTAEQLFAELTNEETTRLAVVAAETMADGDEDLAEDIGKSLATLTGVNLDTVLHAWLDKHHLWPSIVFRNAGSGVRDRVLAFVKEGSGNVNHALCALAWIGDEVVQRRFAEWEQAPPLWRRTLHVGPAVYAHVGGWELSPRGRRDLYFHECIALEVAGDGAIPSAVHLLSERTQRCPSCGDALVHLLEIPIDNSAFRFLGLKGVMLPVLTCERCTCWSRHLFARVAKDGTAELHPANQRDSQMSEPNFSWERGPWQGRAVTLKKRPAIYAADWCMQVPGTQIGGMPTWVQDTAYPTCPDCSRTMRFLAQLDNGHFRGHEGTYFAFLCSTCRVTATTYQQT
jgi:hypothetical protein